MGRDAGDDFWAPGQAGDMDFGVQSGDPGKDAAQRDARIPQAPKAEAKPEGGAGAQGKAADLLREAQTQLGVTYKYGARAWGSALDCSGFTQQAMKRIGIDIGGDTYSQVKQGTAVEGGLANAQPGDLVFAWGDVGYRQNGHVGIYLGNGQVIHAPKTGDVVKISDWSTKSNISAIRRFF